MSIILLTIIILTGALVHGQPCQNWNSNNAYGTFVHRHILTKNFRRSSLQEWKRYLVNNRLCGRVPVQSFIDDKTWVVQQICGNAGRRVRGATASSNLCISNSRMQVYDVASYNNNNGCTVTAANPRTQNVIVACDNVANRCLPVHYERPGNQRPSNIRCI